MPLVFVHGVNTRRGGTPAAQEVYDNRMALIREQFQNIAFVERAASHDGLKVITPYWGDLGVTFARNLACLPQTGVQELAIGQPETILLMEATIARLDAEALQQPELQVAPLLTLARTRSLGVAIDLLLAGVSNAQIPALLIDQDEFEEILPDVARFADAAEQYAATIPHPPWLDGLSDDDTFLNQLIAEVLSFKNAVSPGFTTSPTLSIQTLSIGNKLSSLLGNAVTAVRHAVGTVTGAVAGVATQGVREGYLWFSGLARPGASAFIGRFFGDVFKYMENRQDIIERVVKGIDDAVSAKRPGDNELYLVGHSFGGIILYDILTHFRPDIVCDLYVTVGSQVALFAEIGRLADQANIDAVFASGPTSVIPRPQAAKRWLNIFDPTDLVGFGTRGVFAGAVDYQFGTDALPIVSHGAYFDTPRFYARLRERVREAFDNGSDQL